MIELASIKLFSRRFFAISSRGRPFRSLGTAFSMWYFFEDGTKGDYSWEKILKGAEAFVTTRAATGAPAGAPLYILQGGGAQVAAASPPVATATVGSMSLGVPASFANYPFQAYLGNDWVEGRVVDREVLASGDHRWRVQLPAPRHE